MSALSRGDWLRYDGVVATDHRQGVMCVAGYGPAGVDLGTVEVRLGSRWAPPVSRFTIRTYLGPGSRERAWAAPIPNGEHPVCLTVARTLAGSSFEIDNVTFSVAAPPPSLTC